MTYKEARHATPLDRFMDKVWKTENCWIWTAACNWYTYGLFAVKRRNQAAHRWLYEHLNGPLKTGLQVLHECENPICVNPAHLSAGTRSQNHQMGRPPLGISGFRGVYFDKGREMWKAQIRLNQKGRHLGYFATKEEAAEAYNRAAIKAFGRFVKLNNVGSWTPRPV
jgi:hypothetical protein